MCNRKRQPEVWMGRKWGIVEMKVGNIYIYIIIIILYS